MNERPSPPPAPRPRDRASTRAPEPSALRSLTDRRFEVLYDTLRDLAVRLHRGERDGHTLSPTAIVHEAYVRLARQPPGAAQDPVHFFAVAAAVMRHVLVDHARRRRARKRRAGDAPPLEITVDAIEGDLDVLALDEAMGRLAAAHPRAGRVVELRFFGGLTVEETARYLSVAPRTVDLDWRFARAWLLEALAPRPKDGP